MTRAPRYFSTAAKVHPNYLPHMHPQTSSARMPLRWLKPLAAVLIVGYGLGTAYTSYSDARERRVADAEAATQRDLELRRRNEALMDVYGGRNSIDELEKAMAFYESKKKNQ